MHEFIPNENNFNTHNLSFEIALFYCYLYVNYVDCEY